MYCSHCGNKVAEEAVVCVKCGCAIQTKEEKEPKGKGIASMVLGILGALYTVIAFGALADLEEALFLETNSYKIGYAIGTVLIQCIFATIAICLAISERKKKKNGFNTAGFWLSIATFLLAAIQFIIVICY